MQRQTLIEKKIKEDEEIALDLDEPSELNYDTDVSDGEKYGGEHQSEAASEVS